MSNVARFWAVVREDGTSVFGKVLNGYHHAQVFTIEADAESAREKFLQRGGYTHRDVVRVVEVSSHAGT